MGTMREGGSAVEMPGPWKTWKTRLRFPHVSHRPLEIAPGKEEPRPPPHWAQTNRRDTGIPKHTG